MSLSARTFRQRRALPSGPLLRQLPDTIAQQAFETQLDRIFFTAEAVQERLDQSDFQVCWYYDMVEMKAWKDPKDKKKGRRTRWLGWDKHVRELNESALGGWLENPQSQA